MFVAVRDASLRHADINWVNVAGELGTDSLDLLIEPDLSTSRVADAQGQPYKLASPAGRAAFMQDLEKAGLSVCGVELGTDFAADDVAAQTRWMVEAAGLAAELGAPVVRIDPWFRAGNMTVDAFLPRMAGAVREAIEESEVVDFGVENHGQHGNTPEFMGRLLEMVDSERFGLTLDTGNFYWCGHPLDRVYEIMERFAPHAKYTHVKNISYPADVRQAQREVGWEYLKYVSPIPDGDIDHRRVVRILADAGYDRGLVIEDESHVKLSAPEFADVLRRGVDHLKGLLG